MNKIYVLGIGPGNRDYLLKITENIIKSSDVLIGGSRALELFADLEKEKIKITADLDKIKNYLNDNYQKKVISVLVSGDPGLYSMLNYLKRHFAKEILEVIPGISSLQLASARLRLNWNDMKISSLHGKHDKKSFLEDLKENNKVALFTDNKFPPDQIAAYLLQKGIKNRQAIVLERLSYPDERIIRGSLDKIKSHDYAKLTVMVIYDEKMEI